ncbi:MAG: hypothetical protein K2X08_04770 [Chlamydiales bacterium]|nr:hypothetical protein [Chlamydiales bacterium]
MKWLVSFILCCCLLLLFFPKIASTSFGKQLIIKAIEKKTDSQIQIQSLNLSWFGPQSFNQLHVQKKDIDASCEELKIYAPLWKLKSTKGPFAITNGKASFHQEAEALVENIQATIEGIHFSAKGSTQLQHQKGSFTINGTLPNFPHSFSLQAKLSSIPSVFCDQLLHTGSLLTQILGNSLSLQGSVDAQEDQGVFDFELDAPQCQTKVSASFDKQTIHLQKTLTASLTLTPSLSKMLTKKINPLFLTAIQANHPIYLQLFPENASFPYAPFQLDKVNLDKGSIDMGKVSLQNGPSLQSLLQFLQNNPLQHTQTMEAWFTPLDFQIQNGILKAGRVDLLLARSIHLCTWGKITLSNEKLRMYLGLPSDTLATSFKIANLPADYVLKIPVQGTISDPQLITGPAIAKITALSASQNLPLPKPAKIFSKVLQQAIIEVKNDPDVPPAKRPFPWE